MRFIDELRLEVPLGIMNDMKLRNIERGLRQGSGMKEGLTISVTKVT